MQFPGAEEGGPVDIVAQFGERPVLEDMEAGHCGRGRLVGEIRGEGAAARLREREQHALRPARAGLAHLDVFFRGAGDEILALRVRQQPAGDPDRAAGVEHMDHRPVIGGVDPQRGVDLAGGRPADQQRHGHFRARHFFGHGDHLVQRGGDEAGQSDHVRLVLVRRLQDLRPRHHDAQVDHVVAIALQHHADDVLADIVHVALHRGHNDLALGLTLAFGKEILLGLDEGDQVGDRLLHDARGFDHLRQEHLTAAEQIADHVHPVHQRALDHFDRAPAGRFGGGAHFLGIVHDMRIDPFDQSMFEPLGDGVAAPLSSLFFRHRIGTAKPLGQRDQPLARIRIAVQDHIFAGRPQFGFDLVVDVELAGVDDRHVHTRRNGVVQEDGMHRLADRLVASEREGQVGQSARDMDMGTPRLDLAASLYEIDAVIVVLLDPRCHGKDVGIEDDVLGREADPEQQLVGALANFDLALFRVGLADLVERHHHHGGAVVHAFARVIEELFLAFLHADGIHDRLAADAFQPRLDHIPFRTVDHDRDPRDVGFGLDQLEKRRHRLVRVEQTLIHVDVEHLGTGFYLLESHFDGGGVIAGHDQLFEPSGPGDIGSLANIDETGRGGGFIERHDWVCLR